MSIAADKAQKEARVRAIKQCQEAGGPNCLCTGGTYTKVTDRCVTYWLNDNDHSQGGWCVYEATWRYKGTCAEVV
jgi:hypothetical protein